jgi:hypothetical protein
MAKKPTNQSKQEPINKDEALTKEEFLKKLNQSIRYKPKPSRGQGKKRTSE